MSEPRNLRKKGQSGRRTAGRERIWRQDTAGTPQKGKESDFIGEIPRNSVVQTHRLHCSEIRVSMKSETGQGKGRP